MFDGLIWGQSGEELNELVLGFGLAWKGGFSASRCRPVVANQREAEAEEEGRRFG